MNIKQKELRPSLVIKKLSRFKLSESQKDTLQSILVSPISYVPNDLFRRPRQMEPIMAERIEVIPGKSLKGDQERTLFLQMNYARHRICQIRRKLLRQARWPKEMLLELLHWYNHQQEYRSKIVTANMGLVLAMAKRSEFPGVEFTDLVSEGSMALLRATEKFDCDRGFKFSTYACRAIFKGFSRTAKQSYRYRSKFPTQWDISLEKDDHVDQNREETREEWVDEVKLIMNENLAELSDIEQTVVDMRFSLSPSQQQPLTLKEVGERLGLTKERIRQIQNKALGKLREVAEERMLTL